MSCLHKNKNKTQNIKLLKADGAYYKAGTCWKMASGFTDKLGDLISVCCKPIYVCAFMYMYIMYLYIQLCLCEVFFLSDTQPQTTVIFLYFHFCEHAQYILNPLYISFSSEMVNIALADRYFFYNFTEQMTAHIHTHAHISVPSGTGNGVLCSSSTLTLQKPQRASW